MPRRVLIIVNPAAGRMRSRRRRLDRVVGALQRLGCPVTVRDAAGAPGMAEALARSAEPEFDVIVAAGGDGTVAAVINGIAAAPRAVAILPFGTANVLAAEIGVPRDAEAQAAMIAAGPARSFWPGRLDGRLFVTSAGAGFDAAVVAAVDPRVKRWGGRLAFAWASIVCLMRHHDRDVTVKADGVVHRAGAAIATTGPLYAGRFLIAPAARPEDPDLGLVLLPGGGRRAVLRCGAALLLGRLPRARGVAILKARSISIVGEAGEPVQADGDIAAHLPLTLEIAPYSIPLIHPGGAPR
ncbi:MAG TPA: diacylglycerol kinase family protein [Stellaceae bacterium]|nr:diacylglycerol kinase family protein [Stellaceae bacterium]